MSAALADSRDVEPTPHWAALLDSLAALGAKGPVVVAFSGGVDSTLLLKAAHDVASAEGVTAVSPSLAASELDDARRMAGVIGARHREVETGEADDPRYAQNARDRCYWCKTHLFDRLRPLVAERRTHGRAGAITYGACLDDLGDDRPGMRAAEEAGVRAPFIDAGLDKAEIREMSRRLGLPTWNKPAIACLASRLPHGTTVTRERLALVERAERAVRALGFVQVRVRLLGDAARVEVDPAELRLALARASELEEACRSAGFSSAFVDPEGYRPGKLNSISGA